MREGWRDDDYLILFDESEVSIVTTRYGISRYLRGYSIVGLKGWDDFIIRDERGKLFTVPTIPIAEDYLSPCHLDLSNVTFNEDPRYREKIKWYVQPVVFGGDPQSEDNMTWVTHEKHAELVRWWNDMYRKASEK